LEAGKKGKKKGRGTRIGTIEAGEPLQRDVERREQKAKRPRLRAI